MPKKLLINSSEKSQGQNLNEILMDIGGLDYFKTECLFLLIFDKKHFCK
jgi:hypothetical protein